MVHYKHVGTDRAIGMDTLHTKDNMPGTAMSSIAVRPLINSNQLGKQLKLMNGVNVLYHHCMLLIDDEASNACHRGKKKNCLVMSKTQRSKHALTFNKVTW